MWRASPEDKIAAFRVNFGQSVNPSDFDAEYWENRHVCLDSTGCYQYDLFVISHNKQILCPVTRHCAFIQPLSLTAVG
jgi:hypothetical protein